MPMYYFCLHDSEDVVDADAEGHLALGLGAGRDRQQAAASLVDRPGAGIVVGADHDGGDAVIDPAVARLDPDLAAHPASRHVGQQVERLGQHMVGRHRRQLRDLDAANQPAQLCLGRRGTESAHQSTVGA